MEKHFWVVVDIFTVHSGELRWSGLIGWSAHPAEQDKVLLARIKNNVCKGV